MSGVSPETLRDAVEAIRPHFAAIIARAPAGGRFTTFQVIRAFRQDPAGEAAYQRALAGLAAAPGWGQAATQILHGQVFPELLRATPGVRFAGFAHDAPPDELDGTAVPSYWRKG